MVKSTWDLGIMMEHEDFSPAQIMMGMDWLMVLVHLLEINLDKNMTTKLALTSLKLNNNQGFSEQ